MENTNARMTLVSALSHATCQEGSPGGGSREPPTWESNCAYTTHSTDRHGFQTFCPVLDWALSMTYQPLPLSEGNMQHGSRFVDIIKTSPKNFTLNPTTQYLTPNL